MSQRPVFVTGNSGKVREVEAILGQSVDRVDLDLPEIQAIDVAVVARNKAEAAFRAIGRPVFVEDTGLYLAGLNGLPGALVRWFLATIGPQGICDLIPAEGDRSVLARTAVAACDGDSVVVLIGETSGRLTRAPRGSGGFGWDAIFQPDGSDRTFAEMDQAERDRFSMRLRAIEQIRPWLDDHRPAH